MLISWGTCGPASDGDGPCPDRNAHAVPGLRTERGDLVLDKLTDHVMGWRETGFSLVRMQDPRDPECWVSGPGGACPPEPIGLK